MNEQKKVTENELAGHTKPSVENKRTGTRFYPYYAEIGVIGQTHNAIPGCRCQNCRGEE